MSRVRQCEYCGTVLDSEQPPVKVTVNEGKHTGRHLFCGINCMAFWTDDLIQEEEREQEGTPGPAGPTT